jgi:hypothetical protein
MNTPEKQLVVDVGGGPDRHLESMNTLRAVQLAQKNVQNRYIVLDGHIPHREASSLHGLFPNLHFVESKISTSGHIPFAGASVDGVEMNHMWTPLTAIPGVAVQEDIKGISGATDYVHVLRESCRILKSNGILSITEKEDRLQNIRSILSHDSYLDLDGMFMSDLGLDTDPKTQTITKITDANRSRYTQFAFKDGVAVYSLELRKR